MTDEPRIPTAAEARERTGTPDALAERRRVADAISQATDGEAQRRVCTVPFVVSAALTSELEGKGFVVRRFTGPGNGSTQISWEPSTPQRLQEHEG